MGEERYVAACPYCDWQTDEQETRQYAKHLRAQHIFDEHEDDRSIQWFNDTPDVEVIE